MSVKFNFSVDVSLFVRCLFVFNVSKSDFFLSLSLFEFSSFFLLNCLFLLLDNIISLFSGKMTNGLLFCASFVS